MHSSCNVDSYEAGGKCNISNTSPQAAGEVLLLIHNTQRSFCGAGTACLSETTKDPNRLSEMQKGIGDTFI